jgi:hypothetical protein
MFAGYVELGASIGLELWTQLAIRFTSTALQFRSPSHKPGSSNLLGKGIAVKSRLNGLN